MPKEKTKKKDKETEVAEKGSFVTMLEIIDMKAYRLQGLSLQKIADTMGRNIQTVSKALALFEKILPEQADLKNKIIERIDEIAERHLQNAEIICQAADNQVMRKIYLEETTAMEAAKIRQIYGIILNNGLGIKDGNMENEGSKNPKIINFINTIINIQNNQKDDRPGSTTRIEETTGKHDDGGEKISVEGIVL
jgi:hypothetical protein